MADLNKSLKTGSVNPRLNPGFPIMGYTGDGVGKIHTVMEFFEKAAMIGPIINVASGFPIFPESTMVSVIVKLLIPNFTPPTPGINKAVHGDYRRPIPSQCR